MPTIKSIHARQILDSRGNPTVEVDTLLDDGTMGRAAVPSGASTGEYEAVEIRDKKSDYMGKSVYDAVNNINTIIAPSIVGKNPNDYQSIDSQIIELDNTPNKSKLGANAILGVSMSIVKSASIASNMELYQ